MILFINVYAVGDLPRSRSDVSFLSLLLYYRHSLGKMIFI